MVDLAEDGQGRVWVRAVKQVVRVGRRGKAIYIIHTVLCHYRVTSWKMC